MTGTTVSISRAWSSVPRPLRFLIVGGINTVFGYTAYALFLLVGLHFSVAAFLGTVAGVLFNFMTTGSLVFDGVSTGRLVRFVAIYGVNYCINVALLAAFVHAGLDPYTAGLACIVPMALVSYLLMRRFVFGGARWR